MDRPHHEHVERALQNPDGHPDDVHVLAAEVLALRKDLATMTSHRNQIASDHNAQQAAMSRIESRVEAWKARTDSPYWIQAAVEIELDMKGVGG